eukprot:2455582-Karenia_brevis.AAC.1
MDGCGKEQATASTGAHAPACSSGNERFHGPIASSRKDPTRSIDQEDSQLSRRNFGIQFEWQICTYQFGNAISGRGGARVGG